MKICGQCGETALIGGFADIPGKEINEVWRCFNCLLVDVKGYNAENGITNPKVIMVREPKPDSAS